MIFVFLKAWIDRGLYLFKVFISKGSLHKKYSVFFEIITVSTLYWNEIEIKTNLYTRRTLRSLIQYDWAFLNHLTLKSGMRGSRGFGLG